VLARVPQSFNRRPTLGMPVKEIKMRWVSIFFLATLAVILIGNMDSAFAQQSGGKNCRMEQQCHWENFKKICVWVKVCR